MEDPPLDTEPLVAEPDTRIPVTVLTGWLGSGKTTLLNHLLQADHGHRLAVIENEFGEVDVDSDLVSIREDLASGEEQIMMLNNGCLCCTVRDDLVEMLHKLSERRDQFDRIVIETTGLANPAPIIQTFFIEESVANNMKLDGVVTLVDAKHVEMHLDEKKKDGAVNEAIEQVAYADRIILNKTDLVTKGDVQRVEQRLRAINGMASIRTTSRAVVPTDYVLGVGGFDLDRIDAGVNFWLGALVEMRSEDLYRMKGVLAIKDFDRRFVCQGVHMLFEGMPDRPWQEGERRSSKMVFIGKDLDGDLLREGFEACRVKA